MKKEAYAWYIVETVVFIVVFLSPAGIDFITQVIQYKIFTIIFGVLIALAYIVIPPATLIFWYWMVGYPASILAAKVYEATTGRKTAPPMELDAHLFTNIVEPKYKYSKFSNINIIRKRIDR